MTARVLLALLSITHTNLHSNTVLRTPHDNLSEESKMSSERRVGPHMFGVSWR